MKRIGYSILLAIVSSLLITTTVLAVVYKAPFTITEANGNPYTMLGVRVSHDNEWLADNGFMKATALDTRVETLGGLEKGWMVTDDYTFGCTDVPANSQVNLYYTTGNTDATNMDIVTGYQGYITVLDDADLELDDGFTLEIEDAYINTVAGADKYIFFKDDAFRVEVSDSTSGTVSAFIKDVAEAGAPSTDNYSPTANGTLSQNTLTGATRYGAMSDSNDATFLVASTSTYWTDTFTNTTIYTDRDQFDVIDSVKVYWRAYEQGANCDGYATLYISGSPYNGTLEDYTNTWAWYSYEWTQNPDTASDWEVADLNGLEFGFTQREKPAGGTNATTSECYVAIKYYPALTISAVNVTTGEHDIDIMADGVDFEISIDGAVAGDYYDTTTLGGIAVDDNANNILIMDNSTTDFMSYMSYFKLTTDIGGSSLKAWYQPVTMIIGTELVDRQGGDEDGAFTFGSNPAGITATLDYMTSENQPILGFTEDAPTRDILPAITVSDWFGDNTVSGGLLTNPARPFVRLLSDNTQLSELQSWRFLMFTFILLVTVVALRFSRGHLAIVGIGIMACNLLAVALGIYPLWTMFISAVIFIGILVAERTPSL